MILVSKTYWGHTPFFFRRPPNDATSESLVLRTEDFRQIRAVLWSPAGAPAAPRVGVVAMHPRVDFTHHYAFPRLVEAGFVCLGATSRHANSDLDMEHEPLLFDVAACVRFLREKRGVERVVLLGNSGGGALFGFYQAEASRPPGERLKATPAGGETRFEGARFPPADGLALVAAHRGPAQVLAECIDPSVVDEADPLSVDPSLDLYDPANGFREPPEWSAYSPEFLARFRAAQRARIERVDAVAREHLRRASEAKEESEREGFSARPEPERRRVLRARSFEAVLTVYRTMANPNYVDRSIDPSPREYGSLLSDRPDLMNMALLGFARVVTPRAWLSTWSATTSNADLTVNLRGVRAPTLVVHAGRDREIYPRTDAARIFEASAATDKTFVEQPNARHYFEPDFGEREAPEVEAVMDVVVRWIRERFA